MVDFTKMIDDGVLTFHEYDRYQNLVSLIQSRDSLADSVSAVRFIDDINKRIAEYLGHDNDKKI